MNTQTTKILFQGGTPFRPVKVLETDGKRYLAFGPEPMEYETAYNTYNPDESIFEYPCLMTPALPLKPDTRELLMIGLGGGYLPRILRKYRPDIQVTVIEVDPLVAKIAHDFFDFTAEGSIQLILDEGRRFLNTVPHTYDQIWVDAFDGTYIPPELTTIEFLKLCRTKLKHRGLIVQNVHAEHPLYLAHQATFCELFPYIYVVKGARGENAAIIAQKDVIAAPGSLMAAFTPGLKRHGEKLGAINLRREINKASLTRYNDPKAIIRDLDYS